MEGRRAELVVPKGAGLKGPVVKLHNPINENINMNQVFTGIDIRIEAGNPDAIGIYRVYGNKVFPIINFSSMDSNKNQFPEHFQNVFQNYFWPRLKSEKFEHFCTNESSKHFVGNSL